MSRIVITFDPGEDPHVVYGIVRDALAEFRHVRTPAKKYVEDRYWNNPDLNTPKKVAQVENRVALADTLRVEVEE